MNISLKYKADEEYIAHNESGCTLPIDMLSADQKKAFSPTELLLAGVVACAAVDIVSMIKKRRKTFIDMDAAIIGERKDDHPRGFKMIRMKYTIYSPDATDQEVERIVDLAVNKYCSVADSLNKEIALTHEFEIKRQK